MTADTIPQGRHDGVGKGAGMTAGMQGRLFGRSLLLQSGWNF